MTSKLPTETKYYPEELIYGDLVNLTAGIDTKIKTFTKFSPNRISLTGIALISTDGRFLRVSSDGEDNTIDADSGALKNTNLDLMNEFGIISFKELVIRGFSSALVTNFQSRFTLLVDKTTIVDKMIKKIALSREETELAEKYSLAERIMIGLTPSMSRDITVMRSKLFSQSVRDVIVSRVVSVSLNGSSVVGTKVSVPSGHKAVIVEIGTEQGTPGDGTRVIVERDNQEGYIDVDTSCMGTKDYSTRCFIPALDSFRVTLASAVAVNNQSVRYRYIVAPLTLYDKARWIDSPLISLSDAENLVMEREDLVNKIKAGLF